MTTSKDEHEKRINEAVRAVNKAMQSAAYDGHIVTTALVPTNYTSGGKCFLFYASILERKQ